MNNLREEIGEWMVVIFGTILFGALALMFMALGIVAVKLALSS